MIEKGAVLEVKKFIKLKFRRAKAHIKQSGSMRLGNIFIKKFKLMMLIEKISIKTRQYAKRQSTWGRGNMKIGTK